MISLAALVLASNVYLQPDVQDYIVGELTHDIAELNIEINRDWKLWRTYAQCQVNAGRDAVSRLQLSEIQTGHMYVLLQQYWAYGPERDEHMEQAEILTVYDLMVRPCHHIHPYGNWFMQLDEEEQQWKLEDGTSSPSITGILIRKVQM